MNKKMGEDESVLCNWQRQGTQSPFPVAGVTITWIMLKTKLINKGPAIQRAVSPINSMDLSSQGSNFSQ